MTTLSYRTCTPQTSPSLSLLGFLGRAYSLWSSRRALARLTAAQLQDVGVTPAQAHREAQRTVWDVPANWRD